MVFCLLLQGLFLSTLSVGAGHSTGTFSSAEAPPMPQVSLIHRHSTTRGGKLGYPGTSHTMATLHITHSGTPLCTWGRRPREKGSAGQREGAQDRGEGEDASRVLQLLMGGVPAVHCSTPPHMPWGQRTK